MPPKISLLPNVAGQLRGTVREERESRALQLIGGSFFALAAYLAVESVADLVSQHRPEQASWAGLTPTVRGSDRVAHYGYISKQGSVWLRWVLSEAA